MNVTLKNPDLNPRVIALFGNSATDKTSFYFADACGLSAVQGTTDSTNGVAFTFVGGTTTVAILKEFLKTYALLIKEYRFLAEDETDLANNLTAVRGGIDGSNQTDVLFSSDATTSFANNPNLLVVKMPFVWTATTALKVTTVGATGHDMTFTFTIATMIPYGQLDAFLAQNPVVRG